MDKSLGLRLGLAGKSTELCHRYTWYELFPSTELLYKFRPYRLSRLALFLPQVDFGKARSTVRKPAGFLYKLTPSQRMSANTTITIQSTTLTSVIVAALNLVNSSAPALSVDELSIVLPLLQQTAVIANFACRQITANSIALQNDTPETPVPGLISPSPSEFSDYVEARSDTGTFSNFLLSTKLNNTA